MKHTTMRIALVAPTFIPSRRANTIQVMKMAQALTLNGHSVHLTSPGELTQPERGGILEPPHGATWPELRHHYGLTTEFPLTWLPARPLYRGYDYALRAIRHARQIQADLLYTRHPQTAALSSLLGMSTILEVHDFPQGAGKLLFHAFLRGRGNRRLVIITEALTHALRHQHPLANPLILPDGVDLARYTDLPDPQTARASLAAQPSTSHLQPSSFTVGYTGHLYPGRGTKLILALAAFIPDFQFLLAGGHPEDVTRLRQQITETPYPLTNVILTGFIPNADLPRYQAACDILLMPYEYEVAASSGGNIAPYLSPMKLFEYLAAGRAILSSDLPVFREVLDAENAILLPSDDMVAWVNAIYFLYEYPEKRARLGQRARLDAEKYTWEARARNMLAGLE